MTSVKGDDAPLVELFGRAMDRIRRRLLADPPDGLRPSQIRVLFQVPPDGASVTELADLLGMTKQGTGQFVTVLLETGHLVVESDPRDARVRRIRRTKAGDRVVASGRRVNAEVEAEWREAYGDRRWDEFRRVLEELARG